MILKHMPSQCPWKLPRIATVIFNCWLRQNVPSFINLIHKVSVYDTMKRAALCFMETDRTVFWRGAQQMLEGSYALIASWTSSKALNSNQHTTRDKNKKYAHPLCWAEILDMVGAGTKLACDSPTLFMSLWGSGDTKGTEDAAVPMSLW